MPPARLRAGRVGKPHGLDGSFHVTQPRAALLELGRRLFVGGEPAEIVRRAGTDDRPIVRLDLASSREGAEALRGRELEAAREEAPELGEDEWWAEDLEGLPVHDAGRPVGRVRRLLALPSCEVLEVERTGGDELLVPLVADAVREVDLKRGVDVDLAFLGEEA